MTIASNNAVDYERVARRTAREIGYDDHSSGWTLLVRIFAR